MNRGFGKNYSQSPFKVLYSIQTKPPHNQQAEQQGQATRAANWSETAKQQEQLFFSPQYFFGSTCSLRRQSEENRESQSSSFS